MTTVIHFIRHGVTASNRERRYMGRSQEALAGDGRLQARRLARRMAGVEIDALYCSPLRRARETAEIVAQPHALEPQPTPDFNELDLSRWAGLTAEEVEASDPESWRTWCNDPAGLRLEGVESFAAARQRVRRGLQMLGSRHPGGSVAVVTHDGIVRIAVLEGLGVGLHIYRSIPVDNASMTTLELATGRNYLRALNDTGHLEELARQAPPGPADR